MRMETRALEYILDARLGLSFTWFWSEAPCWTCCHVKPNALFKELHVLEHCQVTRLNSNVVRVLIFLQPREILFVSGRELWKKKWIGKYSVIWMVMVYFMISFITIFVLHTIIACNEHWFCKWNLRTQLFAVYWLDTRWVSLGTVRFQKLICFF